jgi:hypothetical protein
VVSVTAELVAVCCLVVTGCSASGDASSRPAAGSDEPTMEATDETTDGGTALEDVDTTALRVRRAPFCHRVDPAATTQALGEEAAEVSAYRPGQRVRITRGVSDVVHEFGCRWTVGKDTAEAWVFAPPVTRRRAAGLVQAKPVRTCQDDEAAPAFGDPYTSCLWRAGAMKGMRLAGLFGDAWLSCSLTLAAASEEELTRRATRWCAAVALGAAH